MTRRYWKEREPGDALGGFVYGTDIDLATPVVGCGVVKGSREQAAERMLQAYIVDMLGMHPADKTDPHMMRLEMRRLLAAALGEQENR